MSLDFLYYPISWIMKMWYKLFCLIFHPSSPYPWILSVILLVVTIRVLLAPFAYKQTKTQRLLQQHAPQLAAIRKKYKNDPQMRFQAEKEYKDEQGIKTLAGCLPQIAQLFLFISLYHVIRTFNKLDAGGFIFSSTNNIDTETARHTPNYCFSGTDVQNFLDARIFGVPLSSYITQAENQFHAYFAPGQFEHISRWHIALVLAPLMITSALATHLNARVSISRQSMDEMIPGAPKIMNFLMLWVFPLGSLLTGFIMPGSLLLYFMTNNLGTYVQTHFSHKILDNKEVPSIIEVAQKHQHATSLKPKPGAKPIKKVTTTAQDLKPKPGAKPARKKK